MARLTLNGMYDYDPTLFEGMILPEDYDRDALLFEILQRSGQLYPYHQQPLMLKTAIRLWFARNYLNFDRTMEALTAEYNPIENYNRYEDWTRTPDLTDTGTTSGTDSDAKTGTEAVASTGKDTDQLSGSDTTALSGKDTVKLSGKDTTALSGTDTTALSGSDTTTRTHTNYHEENTRTGTVTTEKQVSAYDSGSYSPAEKEIQTFGSLTDDKAITGSYADATAYGKSEGTTYGKKDEITYGKQDETTYGKSEGTTYGKKDEITYGRTDTTTYNTLDTTSYNKTLSERHTGNEDFTSHIHGNIGVTTTQDMITQELELRKFDIYVDIAARFEHEFCVQVY